MNIQKKIKVIDSVFFNGEIDYLQFRFTELNDYVDYFIVLETTTENLSKFEKNLELFELWKDKIVHIKSKIPSEENIEVILKRYGQKNSDKINISKLSQIYDLNLFLDSLNLNFEDVILVSKIDEIPVLPPMEVLQSFLSFEPIVFSQKNFLWNKEYVKSENHLGTLCFQYSHFVLNNTIPYLFKDGTSKDISLNFTPINFGYRFSFFKSVEDVVDDVMLEYNHDNHEKVMEVILESKNDLVYHNLETLSNAKPLIRYDGLLPKHIDMLKNQKIGRFNPKKHIVVIGIDSSYELDVKEYDTVSIVTPTDKVSSKYSNVVSDKITLYYIVKPVEPYYDVLIEDNTLENFQKMYFLNEIKKILFSLNPLDFDIFEFKVGGKLLSFVWSDIKDKFIYDIIKNPSV